MDGPLFSNPPVAAPRLNLLVGHVDLGLKPKATTFHRSAIIWLHAVATFGAFERKGVSCLVAVKPRVKTDSGGATADDSLGLQSEVESSVRG